MAFTELLRHRIVEHFLRGQAVGKTEVDKISLWSVLPDELGAGGTEITTDGTNGYARQDLAFTITTPTDSETENVADITFGPCDTVAWATIVGLCIHDDNGDIIIRHRLTHNRVVTIGGIYDIPAGFLKSIMRDAV